MHRARERMAQNLPEPKPFETLDAGSFGCWTAATGTTSSSLSEVRRLNRQRRSCRRCPAPLLVVRW